MKSFPPINQQQIELLKANPLSKRGNDHNTSFQLHTNDRQVNINNNMQQQQKARNKKTKKNQANCKCDFSRPHYTMAYHEWIDHAKRHLCKFLSPSTLD